MTTRGNEQPEPKGRLETGNEAGRVSRLWTGVNSNLRPMTQVCMYACMHVYRHGEMDGCVRVFYLHV